MMRDLHTRYTDCLNFLRTYKKYSYPIRLLRSQDTVDRVNDLLSSLKEVTDRITTLCKEYYYGEIIDIGV